MESKIKKYQKKEFTMRNIPVDDNMSFREAQVIISGIEAQELAEKKQKKKSISNPTAWKEDTGVVVVIDHYSNRGVLCDGVTYYISMQEPNLEKIKTGAKVVCLIGKPGEHRPVAKDLKLV